jgi:uncharacterized membrane protein
VKKETDMWTYNPTKTENPQAAPSAVPPLSAPLCVESSAVSGIKQFFKGLWLLAKIVWILLILALVVTCIYVGIHGQNGWVVTGVMIGLVLCVGVLPAAVSNKIRERIKERRESREFVKWMEQERREKLARMSPEERELFLLEESVQRTRAEMARLQDRGRIHEEEARSRRLVNAFRDAEHDEYLAFDKDGRPDPFGPVRDAVTARQRAGDGGRVEWKRSYR